MYSRSLSLAVEGRWFRFLSGTYLVPARSGTSGYVADLLYVITIDVAFALRMAIYALALPCCGQMRVGFAISTAAIE